MGCKTRFVFGEEKYKCFIRIVKINFQEPRFTIVFPLKNCSNAQLRNYQFSFMEMKLPRIVYQNPLEIRYKNCRLSQDKMKNYYLILSKVVFILFRFVKCYQQLIELQKLQEKVGEGGVKVVV